MKSEKLVVGILAHVDAGKTTLAESMLYLSGSIRKLGRVDHKDAFLDTYALERERGITIFSKQAEFRWKDKNVSLLDTPGHVDFSAEMERTLQVLDYAILVISGSDGVQGHVETLWKLLAQYHVPVFLFINKMDQEGTDPQAILKELKKHLDSRCIDFEADPEEFLEETALCDEDVLEHYLESGRVEESSIVDMIEKRQVFPCYFGSALKIEGVKEFLDGFYRYTRQKEYPEEFGARVYKIGRDAQGARLTYMKITGGSLSVKEVLHGKGENAWEEKVDQIRVYSGAGYEAIAKAEAGMVCAVTGLSATHSGEGIGGQTDLGIPFLQPVLTYEIILPEDCDVHQMLGKLRQIEEEEPLLHIVWNETLGKIHAQVMGEIQIEILKNLILERFHVEAEFGSGQIVYKETIKNPVEGVGHFEPLRHYAEVHLLIEPLSRGSGLVFDTRCSEDMLDKNWQRLVLTHLQEREHPGVLIGADITDMKLTLISGKAHQKHTEGGDFRQATYRAVRQGLRKAKSILLEPYYEFKLEVPAASIGRAMSDVQRMSGTFEAPVTEGDMAVLTGSVPVIQMQNYQIEVAAYTKGRGRLFLNLKGYEVCHNAEEVIEQRGYDPEADTEHPTGSVFCKNGAGYLVDWDKVEEYMHIPLMKTEEEKLAERTVRRQSVKTYENSLAYDKELEEIFNRTFGRNKKENKHSYGWQKEARTTYFGEKEKKSGKPSKKPCLLVDGYNIIFAWEYLRELAEENLDSARGKLLDILSNYQGYRNLTMIVVFDAYKVEGGQGAVEMYHKLHVVYTKEAETADQYIERTVHELGNTYDITVATSDATEQVIIFGAGAQRMSARNLLEEVELANEEIRELYGGKEESGKNYLFKDASEEIKTMVEEVRLGKRILK